MKRLRVFKIKEGKRDKWIDWCEEIMTRYREAVLTLEEENIVSEKCTIAGDFVIYEHEIDLGKEKLPMNMGKEINQKHATMMEECLERLPLSVGYWVIR